MSKPTQLATTEKKVVKEVALAPAENSADLLISQAVAQGLPVETMERLVALRDQIEAKNAKKAFDEAGSNIDEKGRKGIDKWLVILDDKASDKDVMQSPYIKMLYTQIRHRGGSIIISTQSYMMVAKGPRTQCNFLVFFNQPNAKEVRTIVEEICPVGMKEGECLKMLADCVAPKYQCLVRHATREPWDQFYINFTEPVDITKYFAVSRVKTQGLEELVNRYKQGYEKIAAEAAKSGHSYKPSAQPSKEESGDKEEDEKPVLKPSA
jgi:hypothetical protein